MKFTTDFTTINGKTYVDIVNEIEASLNARTVFVCRYNNHPEDSYLYLYIAQARDHYITGLANINRGHGVGLYENHYNVSFKQAMEILTDKISDYNKTEEV